MWGPLVSATVSLLLGQAEPPTLRAGEGVLLVDPARISGHVIAPEQAWALRLAGAEPPGKSVRKALVALARPCSAWVHDLRALRAEAAQRLFEQCVVRAMADDFDNVALLPHIVPPEPSIGGAGEAERLEAVLKIELDCVDALGRKYGPVEQDRLRQELNSWWVARYKVSFTRACLDRKLADAGLKHFAAYHYSRAQGGPRNH